MSRKTQIPTPFAQWSGHGEVATALSEAIQGIRLVQLHWDGGQLAEAVRFLIARLPILEVAKYLADRENTALLNIQQIVEQPVTAMSLAQDRLNRIAAEVEAVYRGRKTRR